MADGEIRVKVDDETEQRLRALAEASGQSVGEFVRDLIADSLDADQFADAQEALEEYDRTGVSHDAASELAAFRARVVARVGRG